MPPSLLGLSKCPHTGAGLFGGVQVWFTPGEGRGLQRQENVGDFAVVLESEDWGKNGEAMVTPVPGGHCDVPNRLFLKRGTQRTHNHVSVEQDSC